MNFSLFLYYSIIIIMTKKSPLLKHEMNMIVFHHIFFHVEENINLWSLLCCRLCPLALTVVCGWFQVSSVALKRQDSTVKPQPLLAPGGRRAVVPKRSPRIWHFSVYKQSFSSCSRCFVVSEILQPPQTSVPWFSPKKARVSCKVRSNCRLNQSVNTGAILFI